MIYLCKYSKAGGKTGVGFVWTRLVLKSKIFICLFDINTSEFYASVQFDFVSARNIPKNIEAQT